jgi:hypothetical protein
MESTGHIHKKPSELLRAVAERADGIRKLTTESVLACVKRRLSCALVKIMADSIIGRTTGI